MPKKRRPAKPADVPQDIVLVPGTYQVALDNGPLMEAGMVVKSVNATGSPDVFAVELDFLGRTIPFGFQDLTPGLGNIFRFNRAETAPPTPVFKTYVGKVEFVVPSQTPSILRIRGDYKLIHRHYYPIGYPFGVNPDMRVWDEELGNNGTWYAQIQLDINL